MCNSRNIVCVGMYLYVYIQLCMFVCVQLRLCMQITIIYAN